jgi:hypothetical protein
VPYDIVICSLWLYDIFPKAEDFLEKFVEYTSKMCILFFSTNFVFKKFFILSRIKRDITINLHGFHEKCPLVLSDFNGTCFLGQIFEKFQIRNFTKIRPLAAEQFHAE